MFMGMARLASQRATCHRLNVGAIVTREDSPVSVGWNGHDPGAPHCAGNDCPGIVPGKCGTHHAEANALGKAERILEWYAGKSPEVDLYLTHSPCGLCATRIMNSSLYVKRVFFEIPYRDTSCLGMFIDEYQDPEQAIRLRKTEVYEVTPAGYVVDYFTRKVVELP